MAHYFMKRACAFVLLCPVLHCALTLRLLRHGSRCLRYQLNVRILVGTSRKESCLVGLIHKHIDDPSIGCMDSANLLRTLDTHVITFLKVGAFSICLHGSICLSRHVDDCACPCSPRKEHITQFLEGYLPGGVV